MKRSLWMLAVVLCVSMATSVYGAAALELVSGTSTLYVSDNGSVTCSGPACSANPATDQNAFTGGISLAGVVFDGYNITITTGGSNSPNCGGSPNGPGCLNTTNITATNVTSGSATLSVYFADTGFTETSALKVGFSTPGETGTTATQTAYAQTTGTNPLGSGVLTPTAGLSACGASLTINGPTGNTSLGTGCGSPGTPYLLLLGTTISTPAGGAFNVNGTISAVPEPASVVLLGSMLLGTTAILRKKFRRA